MRLKARSLTTVLLTSAFVVACGGGGDSSSDGPVSGQTGANTVSLSGTSIIATGLIADSDTNDPFADFATNNTPDTAQAGPNPGQVLGYMSQNGDGPSGSRFADEADIFDAYRISLAAGQTVSVQMANWNSSSGAQDIDLFLYDLDVNPIQSSEGVSSSESIRVQTSATYYVLLRAIAGSGNYNLKISSGEGSNLSAGSSLSRFDKFEPGEMVVTYKDQINLRVKSFNIDSANSIESKPHKSATLVSMVTALNATSRAATVVRDAWSNKVMDEEMVAKAELVRQIKQMRLDSTVEYAEPNLAVESFAIPNDPLYDVQWHYPKINLPAAWDITEGAANGEPVIVAVIDTGVVLNHPDLQGQLVPGYDFIREPLRARDGGGIDSNPTDEGDDPTPGLSSWHGTHVAGTVAARSNNSIGLAGVAPLARVMPIRVLGANLEGSGPATVYDIAQGILFAAGLSNDSGTVPARRADVINLSLGGPGRSETIANAVSAAQNAGVVVVAAAGNNGTSEAMFPASLPGVISVSATTLDDKLASYSSFGSNIDISAPGGDLGADLNSDSYADGVASTYIRESEGSKLFTYKFLQGTSMAAPHVAGVVALMKAANPNLSPAQVNQILTTGGMTNEAGAAGRDDAFGFGVIDAYKAVLAAQSASGDSSNTARLLTSVSRLDYGRVTSQLPLTLEASGGDVTGVLLSSTDDWLQISNAVQNDGKLDYTVSIDRSALADGIHRSTVSINSSAGLLTLPVTVDNTTLVLDGDAGRIYYLLVRADDQEIEAQAPANASGGQYTYRFQEIPEGDYYLVAGSDQNNDGFICGEGEACGGWPIVNSREILSLTNDRSGVDFPIGLQNSLTQSQGVIGASVSKGFAIDKSGEL